MSQLVELYGVETRLPEDWAQIVAQQQCPYIGQRCTKIRKSTPEITIGSCVVAHGRSSTPLIICPNRLLERRQIFIDCLHLLTTHQPGNELHIIPEITIPGGSVDYFLVSVRRGQVQDFVGIELQALDTTGSVWPTRQAFLQQAGLTDSSHIQGQPFGLNWKMTAKTTLIQLNHKIETFQNVNKHLVLVLQDSLMQYMQREFQFGHLNQGLLGDAMQFHVYELASAESRPHRLTLQTRFSTNAEGVAKSLGLQANPNLTLAHLIGLLQAKLSPQTLFTL